MNSLISEEKQNNEGFFQLFGTPKILQKPILVINHQCGITFAEWQKVTFA